MNPVFLSLRPVHFLMLHKFVKIIPEIWEENVEFTKSFWVHHLIHISSTTYEFVTTPTVKLRKQSLGPYVWKLLCSQYWLPWKSADIIMQNIWYMTPGFSACHLFTLCYYVWVFHAFSDSGMETHHRVHYFSIAALTSHHKSGGLKHTHLLS